MIGQIEEQKELNRIYNRDQSDLVAVYGRRRVGKTYLVNETFRGKFAFRHTGLSPKTRIKTAKSLIILSDIHISFKSSAMIPPHTRASDCAL